MREASQRLSTRMLAAAAVATPLVVGALAPEAQAATAPPSLLPAVMHFRVDYDESLEAPAALHGYVEELLGSLNAMPASMTTHAKPGCGTISGSGGGWDDSDYWGNGC